MTDQRFASNWQPCVGRPVHACAMVKPDLGSHEGPRIPGGGRVH